MAAPLCVEHPEEWSLSQDERWKLWGGRVCDTFCFLGEPYFYHEKGEAMSRDRDCEICGKDEVTCGCAVFQRPPIEIQCGGEVIGTISPNVPPKLHENYRRVLKEAELIWLERQGQYGLTDFEIEDVLVLAKIKVSRLMRGTMTEDSFLDLLNYAAIGLMVARGEWCE
jgi:hypothetical protein